MRLFIAIEIPEDLKKWLARLRVNIPGCRWTALEQIHLTLAFLGEVDEARLEGLTAALARIRTSEFSLRLSWNRLLPRPAAPQGAVGRSGAGTASGGPRRQGTHCPACPGHSPGGAPLLGPHHAGPPQACQTQRVRRFSRSAPESEAAPLFRAGLPAFPKQTDTPLRRAYPAQNLSAENAQPRGVICPAAGDYRSTPAMAAPQSGQAPLPIQSASMI